MENQRQRGNDIGETGRTVAANIARIRKSQQISLKDLENRLIQRGRRISLSGLSKIENGDRKVDVDDLMALALALDVSPIALLLPASEPDDIAEVAGGRGSVGLLWEWAFAQHALSGADQRTFQARSLPGWYSASTDIESKKVELHLGFNKPGLDRVEDHVVIRYVHE